MLYRLPQATMLNALVRRSEGRRLVVLHFNDVYDVSEDRAAKFVSVINSYAERKPLILFSGDCFSPSLMSVITKGAQMPPILNAIGVQAAVLGNHEFDWGLPRCEELCSLCTFPWLMSNCWVKETGDTLGGGERTVLLEHNGVKVGLIGLIEREWLACLSTIDEEELEYRDFVDIGRELCAELRGRGAEVVFALTHMRKENDERLLAEVPELDLILGGHDHEFEHISAPGAEQPTCLKSGTDFRELSEVVLQLPRAEPHAEVSADASARGSGAADDGSHGARVVSVRRVEVGADEIADAPTRAIVHDFESLVDRKMGATVGATSVELDATFRTIRSSESNVSNFVADVLREGAGADLCILNAGTIRADRTFAPGPLTMRDLFTMLPMADESCVLKMAGADVLAALENGVSSYPRLDGRWPCVSGIRFAFDPSQPVGSRVVQGSVRVDRRPTVAAAAVSSSDGDGDGDGWHSLDLTAQYTVATKSYLASGRDGYAMFKRAELVLDGEQAPLLPGLVRNHFVQRRVGRPPRSRPLLAAQARQAAHAPRRRASRAGGASSDTPSLPAAAEAASGTRTAGRASAAARGDDAQRDDAENRPPPAQMAPATPAATIAVTPAAKAPAYRTPKTSGARGDMPSPSSVIDPMAGAICPAVEGRIVRIADLPEESKATGTAAAS